jgi:hypothetical protein
MGAFDQEQTPNFVNHKVSRDQVLKEGTKMCLSAVGNQRDGFGLEQSL